MLSVRLDHHSPLAVRWPTTDDNIIALGDAWVLYENSRPAPTQLKDITLTLVQTKLTAAKAARASAQTGEATRTIASGDYRTTLATIKTNLDRSLTYLKYRHANNLLLLENWGWNVRHTAKGGLTVRMPTKNTDLLELLDTYLAYESGLPPENRIADPAFAAMQTLQVDANDYAQARGSSKVQRTANVYERSAAVRELLDLLQGMAVVLCLLNYNGQLHPNLANWGYSVIGVPPKEGENGGGEEPPEYPPGTALTRNKRKPPQKIPHKKDVRGRDPHTSFFCKKIPAQLLLFNNRQINREIG